jgi:hypothetical protein
MKTKKQTVESMLAITTIYESRYQYKLKMLVTLCSNKYVKTSCRLETERKRKRKKENKTRQMWLDRWEILSWLIASDLCRCYSRTWYHVHPSNNKTKYCLSSFKSILTNQCYIPIECILTFSTKEIHVIFKLKLENKIFIDTVGFQWQWTTIAEQWQRCQWEIILYDNETTNMSANKMKCIRYEIFRLTW